MPVIFQASGAMRDGTFVSAANRRVVVEVRDRDGAVKDRFQVNPLTPRSRSRAVSHGPDDATVIRICDETLKTGQAVTWEAPVMQAKTPDGYVTITRRPFEATSGEEHTGPALITIRDLLGMTPVDMLLTWAGKGALCCLDIDYHLTRPPIRSHLEAWIETRIAPRPAMWHFSRGGGAHLFYVGTDRFTAEELAAAAAIRFRTIDPSAGLDLVTHVRGAGSETVRPGPGGSGGAASLPGTGEASEEAIQEWLDANGVSLGSRYDHDKCPINPTKEAGQRQPVTVTDAGVFCFSCAAKGLSLGSRKPGFASWTALCATPGSGDVSAMVKNKVHWGHARWVLTEKYELPEQLARLGYAAALKAAHEELADDELARVFSDDTADMARANDSWVNLLSGNYHYPERSSMPLLGTLPTCLFRDEKGKLRPVASRVAYMVQGHDLSDRGYSNLRVVRGFRMAREFLPSSGPTYVSVLEKELRKTPCAPRYLPRKGRKPVEWAESVYERYFPGMCWPAVRSQVCAAGSAQETRLGLQPMTFLAGASGAAKTTTVKLAAGILGTAAPDVTYLKDEEKLKRAVATASTRGAFALCNEFLKDHQRANGGRADPRAAMETILNLTPEALVHVMYLGPRPLGKLPAIVFTETNCPYQLRDYVQISRRVRLVRLFGRKDSWKESIAGLNLTPDTLHLYRLRDPELNEAADVILSDLVDRFFSTPPGLSWDSIADSLGCPTIETSTDFDDPKPDQRRFFELVCAAPEIEEERLRKRFPGGYKRIHRADNGDDAGELSDLWNQFADKDWFNSQILSAEASWSDLIGSDQHVRLDVRSDGVNSVFVRFCVGPITRPLYVNGDIPRRATNRDQQQ